LQEYSYTHTFQTLALYGREWSDLCSPSKKITQVPSGFETGLNPAVSVNNKLIRHTELNKVSCIKFIDESLIFSGS
jgi:hypothetical protein